MRYFVILASLLVSFQSFADAINLGDASKYNAFIKKDFSVVTSDVEGRIAVGGNLNIGSQYDIGTQINNFGMGSGPSLVVGGNIVKNGSGNLGVYRSETPSELGDAVLSGALTINGGSATIGNLTQHSTNLPVDFDSAFAHLETLSKQLSERTATSTTDHGWALEFKVDPNVIPDDNVYVFNVTQDQFTTDWYVNTDGMKEDATVVFNISNPSSSTVTFSQANVFLANGSDPFKSSDPLSGYFNKGAANGEPPVQVLYNFYGASQLNLNTSDLFGSILAPTADIVSAAGQLYGQVIGKSWSTPGNQTQINYNPFEPVPGTPTTPVPEPSTLLSFALALVIMLGRKKLSLVKSRLFSKKSTNKVCFA
ncbi:MAG: choice-of-anchor A domain-containing protein [Alteromonadaceae bacterium]|jgi:choice-of-anchor A domain-containing protein